MFRLAQIAVGFTTRGRESFFHLSSVESFLICCGTVEGIVNSGDLFGIHEPGENIRARVFSRRTGANNSKNILKPNE